MNFFFFSFQLLKFLRRLSMRDYTKDRVDFYKKKSFDGEKSIYIFQSDFYLLFLFIYFSFAGIRLNANLVSFNGEKNTTF